MAKRHMFCAECGSQNLSVYFPTPLAVAQEVVARAIDREQLTVLEPSAGTGHLARLAVEAGATVDCIELQQGFADDLAESRLYRQVTRGDFLCLHPDEKFDRIIMNPPFENGADMDHVASALGWLKPSGRLVAVMSAMAGERNRRKDKAFKQLIGEHSATRTELPPKAFAESGTNVACVLVQIDVPA